MTTTKAAWPTQILLPGQAAAPDGPVDMANMYLFHHAFRRDLDRFLRAVPHVALDDLDAWRRLSARWGVLVGQLHHHHEAEDTVLWPWLRERATPEQLLVLDAMEQEHDEIDPGLAQVTAALAALASAGGERAGTRAALSVRLAGVREVLDRHLGHEETDAIALLQQVTTQAEWVALEKRFSKGQPPTAVLQMLPWVVDGVDEHLLRRVLSSAPAPMRLLVRLLHPRFSRREREIFATT
ncbi:hemerythrin HHE cation binding domain-containing protein [Motilibacter rhizosphaerae]|uniref:Hemerythrin HHE cation binding domain-containing protein n=1 Tax=Motilibacter rhizosphaerae TaxID=598652 RepID=A0A4Q7NB06_9ACTN|nr:hemerythrin domain-containing protein [Motilibacter rhizosphaerae]RZS80141.1 hemerythrin HHE cation binding domain-containing protein [Motilibacter rhizosphaerae]